MRRKPWYRACVAAAALAALMSAAVWSTTRTPDASPQEQAARDRANWERQWITPLDPNVCTTEPGSTSRFNDLAAEHALRLDGGSLELDVDLDTGRAQGTWRLRAVEAPWGWLHLQAPPGFRLQGARAAQSALASEIRGSHIAVALDACARAACDVALDFSVDTGAKPAQAGLLSAQQLLPRLGLDGDRVLRDPLARERQGLPQFVTLPDHSAAVALAGVAPAGRWDWQARMRQAGAETTERGHTDGALDFALPAGQLSPANPQLRAEAEAMRACVAGRMGAAPAIGAVAIAPVSPLAFAMGLAGEPGARLSAGTLWLPETLRQEPALRQAEMARAIALRQLADAGRLRQSRGAQWLASGLPGAVALLCASATHPPAAAQALLQRVSAQATRAMQAQAGEVTAVAFAAFDGWVRDYAPLSALDSVRRLSAAQIQALLAELGHGVRMQYALSTTLGTPRATLALSMPLASDLRASPGGRPGGERWRWQQGGWKPLAAVDKGWAIAEATATEGALWLDAWPGYERNFADNLAAPAPAATPHSPTPSRFAGKRP